MPGSSIDFIHGIDPTALSTITGAQLAQLIDSATPYTDKGLIIATSDINGAAQVPNALTTAKWQRYIWLRIGASSVTPYVWNPAVGDQGNMLYWVSVAQSSIGPNTITSEMIRPTAVTSDKVLTLDAAKLTGTLPASITATLLTTGTAIPGGDLEGTYGAPTIKDLAVDNAAIANATIKAAKLASAVSGDSTSGGVIATNIRGNATAGDQLRSVGDYTTEWFTPKAIVTGLDNADAGGADDGSVVVVDSGADKTFKYLTQEAVRGYAQSTKTVAVPAQGATAEISHLLGVLPQQIRVVLECLANDAATGYLDGEEIDITSVMVDSNERQCFNVYTSVDGLKVHIVRSSVGARFDLYRKADGVKTTVTATANFQIKVYCNLFS